MILKINILTDEGDYYEAKFPHSRTKDNKTKDNEIKFLGLINVYINYCVNFKSEKYLQRDDYEKIESLAKKIINSEIVVCSALELNNSKISLSVER